MSPSRNRARILAGLLFALTTLPVRGDVPPRDEQFIYAVISFNGKDYSSTFVREPSADLYLMADSNNFLSARKVFVYFWPIGNDYRLDTDALNHRFSGALHVSGNGIERDLSEREFTYYNLRGDYELNWHVAEGPEAFAVYRDYQNLEAQFGNAQAAYVQEVYAYQQKVNDLAVEVAALRAKGADAADLVAELNRLKPPEAPVPSQKYAAAPVPIQQAFIVNLPAGTYRVFLKNPDGTVMQGSEKRLVVFRQRSADSVGYEVIPGDKWTRPETSKVPSSILYVDGSADLYLRPFYESDYNDLHYEKLIANDAPGNRNLSQWVRLQQVPHARIVAAAPSGTTPLSEQAFAIQQSSGQALGYTIVPWNQQPHRSTDKPDLIAIHLPIRAGIPVLKVSTQDESGKELPGSEREIRLISGPGAEAALIAFLLSPIACALIVMLLRARWRLEHNRPSQHEAPATKKT